jgi:hypothetical protein
MKQSDPASPRPAFEAFVTTAENGGPRVPVEGERLVIVMGRDAAGRPLELSLYLQPWPDRPSQVVVAAVDEASAPSQGRDYWPRLVVHPSQGPNLISLSVAWDHIPMGGAPAVGEQ